MSEHLHDEEQVEALKRWWTENGKSTILAVVLAVGGTFGWQQYQGWDAGRDADASEAYSMMLLQLDSQNPMAQTQAIALANELKNNYESSSYARFAAMTLAAQAVEAQDFDTAEAELRWALQHGDNQSEMGQLIQLRLARVLAAKGENDAALAILNAGSNAYPAAFSIAIGDIHLAAERESEALTAYLKARDFAAPLGTAPGLLDAKITSLQSRLSVPDVLAVETNTDSDGTS